MRNLRAIGRNAIVRKIGEKFPDFACDPYCYRLRDDTIYASDSGNFEAYLNTGRLWKFVAAFVPINYPVSDVDIFGEEDISILGMETILELEKKYGIERGFCEEAEEEYYPSKTVCTEDYSKEADFLNDLMKAINSVLEAQNEALAVVGDP